MKRVPAFFKRDLQNELTYGFSFLLQVVSIFPSVLMFLFLSQLFGNAIPEPLSRYGGQYFPFVLIGIAVQNYFTAALGSFAGSIRESQLSGTLEAVLATPVPLPIFLLGSTLYAFVFNALRILLYLLLGSLIAETGLDWTRIPAALLVLGLSIAAFSSLGIFSCSFIVLFKKGDPLNWFFSVCSWLLGGVYYPVSVLPEWMQNVASYIPMTYTLEALRIILLGKGSIHSVSHHIFCLAMWVLIVLPLSCLCFRYAVDRARANGTLGHY